MFVDFSDTAPLPDDRSAKLGDDEALILWSLRRLVVAWPRCLAVEVALHRRYGDDGLAVEHLLRCWLGGLASHASHPLRIGEPGCALLLADEGAMLFVLRNAADDRRAGPALAALCGDTAARALLPLAVALAGFIVA